MRFGLKQRFGFSQTGSGGGSVAPSNTVAPVISGLTALGSTLSCTTGTWSGIPAVFTYSYQWKRNGVYIGGATSNTYVTVVADSTANITCEVTASNGVLPNGTTTSNTLVMANYTPVNSVAPAVTGTAVVGQTLTTTNGTWTNSPVSFTYQWHRGATLISGATNSTYTLAQADAGNTSNIKCVVTATNSAGSASADSNTVAQVLTVRTNAFMAASGISDATIRGGLNTFDIGLISNSLDTKMRALYPFVGATAAAHKFNFMNPADTNAAFRLVFNGTNSHTSSGYVPNGTNGYAETFFNSIAQSLSTSSASVSIYQTQISDTGTSRTKMGADDGAALNMFGLAIFNAGVQEMGCVGGSTTAEYAPNGTSAAANGFTMVSTNGSRSAQHYKSGATNGSPSTQTGTFPNRNVFIGAMNRSGTATTFFNKPIAFAHIGDGFSAAQETTLYNLVQALQTTLGRNV